MSVNSLLEVCNDDGKILSRFKTKTFTGAEKTEVIEIFISKKYKTSKPPFNIEILDQHNGYVTLDDDYLKEYDPFHVQNTNATTAQPSTSSEPTVELRVTLSNDVSLTPADQQPVMTFIENVVATGNQCEPEQITDDVIPMKEPSNCPTIDLSGKPKIGFVENYNVAREQRDQYICDQVNVDTGERTGTLSMIQAPKTSTNKFRSRLPRFRIYHDDIKNMTDHVWTLLVFIVWDVCQSGKCSLFKNPQRIFVEKNNIARQWNPYEIPITTMNWMRPIGEELKLISVAIDGAKKHSTFSKHIICDLKGFDQSEPSDTGTSRLALILRKDNDILWETLVLSDEMIFEKKNPALVVRNILDIRTDAQSASSKRKHSTKRRNTSNKRTKQTETTVRENDESQVMTSFLNNNNNNTFPKVLDPSTSTFEENAELTSLISQPIYDMSEIDSEQTLTMDPYDIDNPFKNPINDLDSFQRASHLPTTTNANNNLLHNNDPLLSTSASSAHSDLSDV